jgi:hypothetical protein
MSIVLTLNMRTFVEQFRAVRPNQFSNDALECICNYLDDCGEQVEFDPIAICCEWVEMTTAEAIDAYSIDVPDDADHLERKEAVLDYLIDQTVVLCTDAGPESDGFVFIQF